MKHKLATIRKRQAVEYALEHPETKLSDICIAMGMSPNSDSNLSRWLKEIGHRRPRGFASPAFGRNPRKSS